MLTGLQILPEDFNGLAQQVPPALKRSAKDRRKTCRPLPRSMRAERDGLDASLVVVDAILEEPDPPPPDSGTGA